MHVNRLTEMPSNHEICSEKSGAHGCAGPGASSAPEHHAGTFNPFHFVGRSYMPPCPSFYSPQKSHGHKPDRIIRFNLLLIYLMAWGKGHGHMRGFQGSQERKKKPYYVMPVTSCRVRQLLRERGHEDGHDPLSISGVFFFPFAKLLLFLDSIAHLSLVFSFACLLIFLIF